MKYQKNLVRITKTYLHHAGWKSSNAAFSWLYLSSFPIGANFVSSPRRSSWPGPGCSKSGGVYRDLHGKSGWNGTLVIVRDFPG